MKQVIIFLFFGALAGCSNKKNVILTTADRPTVRFSKDTVTVRENDWTNVRSTGNGKVTLYLNDPTHEMNMQMEDTSAHVHLMYRGVEIKNGESFPVMDSVLLFCVVDLPGLYEVNVWLTDRLGRGDNKKLFIRCVADQQPVATFFYQNLGSEQLQSWNYVFDASNTQKPDGTITEYHYSINGQLVVTNKTVMYWTFHAKGDHRIGLYVVDDLGQKSETVYQTLTIL